MNYSVNCSRITENGGINVGYRRKSKLPVKVEQKKPFQQTTDWIFTTWLEFWGLAEEVEDYEEVDIQVLFELTDQLAEEEDDNE